MFAASGRPTPSEEFHSGTSRSCENLMVELGPGFELPCRRAEVDPGSSSSLARSRRDGDPHASPPSALPWVCPTS